MMNDEEIFEHFYNKYVKFYNKVPKEQLVDIMAFEEAQRLMMLRRK
tara:strand:- start:456 stop:593 length:138 start_codon:yes stop_codon:yes gene_type:complete